MTLKVLAIYVLILLLCPFARAQANPSPFDPVPAKIQAALFIKILAMSKEISNQKAVVIYVLHAPQVAQELQKAVGRKIGKTYLSEVIASDALPLNTPQILYVGNGPHLESCLAYCRQNKVLSITGVPAYVESGVTLGVATQGEKLKILLNVASSKAEAITWNPNIIKISEIIRE